MLRRKFFGHWLWDQERVYNQPESFLDLLQLAAFAPTKRVVQGKLISLNVGELVASERFLEIRWKWSRTKVRHFLELLESDSMLSQRKDQGQTVWKLCNYNKYMASGQIGKTTEDTSDQTTGEPQGNQQGTSGEPNKKKDKKVESEETHEEHSRSLSPPPATGQSAFAERLPTESAQDFDALFQRINAIHPSWRKRPHPTQVEMETALANAKALFAIEESDWESLKAFYAVAEFPADWEEKAKGGVFWRPESRSRFIQGITDILGHLDRWQDCKLKGGKAA